MSAVEILEAAKRRLIEDGWIKERFVDQKNQRCMEGALWNMTLIEVPSLHGGGFRTHSEIGHKEGYCAYEILAHSLGKDEPDYDIATFNDAPKTTFADVMAAFDRAILKAKEEEAA